MHVIIPSIGRESLPSTIESASGQLTQFDDLLVVLDGIEEDPLLLPVGTSWLSVPDEPMGAFGHHARNLGIDWAAREEWPNDYLWSIDDDDEALPGALDAIREAIAENPGRWFIFQMIGGKNSHFPGVTVPIIPGILTRGNVGTPCIVAPASAKARWGTAPSENGDGYFGDYDYAVALQEELGDPVWVPVTVACIRP